jgi:hypothetical protein
MVSHELHDDLEYTIQERDGSKVINSCWIVHFGHQSDEGVVDGFQIQRTIEEIKADIINIIFYNIPIVLEKKPIKAIRAWLCQ